MKDMQIVVERALPSVALVAKYPSLKNLASTSLTMIEDAFNDLSKATGDTEVVWAEKFAAHFDVAVLKETVEFYNTVVRDGRFVQLLGSDPRQAAAQLGVTLSDGAYKALLMARDQTLQTPNIALLARQGFTLTPFVGPAAAIAIVIGVAVAGGALGWHLGGPSSPPVTQTPDGGTSDAAAPREAETITVVIDRSGQIKL